MKKSQFIIEVIKEKYGEWLEMAGENSPALLSDILANLLYREMEEKTYYKMRLNQLEGGKNEYYIRKSSRFDSGK